MRRRIIVVILAFGITGSIGCAGSGEGTTAERTPPATVGREHDGMRPMIRGEPIDVTGLEGSVVFDDFEDVYADGGRRHERAAAGATATGRSSTARGLPTATDRLPRFAARDQRERRDLHRAADGSGAHNLTRNPANDWGRIGHRTDARSCSTRTVTALSMGGYLVSPDGSNLRRIEADVWIEYPSFSPDGTKIAFMGHDGGDYDIYVADLETGAATQLTRAIGSDGWPAWSPDGSTIAFASERDDCLHAPKTAPCWSDPGGEPGEHHDIWLMDADGSNQRRVTPEFGQFVTWSPDGEYLLVSGSSLYVIRPDGTGRADVLPGGGGIPDWIAP